MYEKHKANFEFTKSPDFVKELKHQIWNSGTTLHRWHAFGDFYDFEYFKKCLQVVKELPEIYFFAYTKQASFMKWYMENKLPNMDMVYSIGGIHDKYALKHNLPSCYVVTNKAYKNESSVPISLVNDSRHQNHWSMSKFEAGIEIPIACRKENKYDDLVYIQNQQSFGIFLH